MSLADVAQQAKRLSLHFPVQTGNNFALRSPPLRSGRPTSWALDPIASAFNDNATVLPSPTEGNFLTIIAGQERRVLELKDELKQAEEELKRLKDHYRKHEAFKKRNETVRRVQQLEPLNVSFPVRDAQSAEDDADGSSQWMQREMERRKVLMSGVRSSNRKVFSGSRHTRALSLLSPDRMQAPPLPVPVDEAEDNEDDQIKGLPSLPRSQTLDLAYGSPEDPGARSPGERPVSITRDALLKTGKQMATDLKEGLWTFVEDLRQATIGDEGINGTTSRAELNRRQSNTNISNKSNTTRNVSTSKRQTSDSNKSQSIPNDTSALVDIGGSFWREHGVDSVETSPATKRKSNNSTSISAAKIAAQRKNRPDSKIMTPQRPVRDFDDNWDTWDTPMSQAPESGSSSATASISESSLDDDDDDEEDDDDEASNNSSARTSASLQHDRDVHKVEGLVDDDATDKRDGIPWPALAKLSPSHLKRTASHLMSEWEKSLTPPASEKEGRNYVDSRKRSD